ncbi:MAG: pentapeptide repeat-containing protein [Pirellulales bacterium]
MIDPEIAAVRPRIVFSDAPDAVLLEDEVRARLEAGNWGILEVTGMLGGGKTTALKHLAAVFANEPRLVLCDVPADRSQWDNLGRIEQQTVVVVGISPELRTVPGGTRCRLPAWTLDDWIEYLMARHRPQVASVIGRVQKSSSARLLLGNSELWSAALDDMAADEALLEPIDAVVHRLTVALRPAGAERFARALAFAKRCGSSDAEVALAVSRLEHLPIGAASQLLRHSLVLDMLAAEHLVEKLGGDAPPFVLARPLTRNMITLAAAKIAGNQRQVATLKAALGGRLQLTHANSASLLHAAGVVFLPENDGTLMLDGAQLAGVEWSGLRAHALSVARANLQNADLRAARITDVLNASQAQFNGAKLSGARIKNLRAVGASLRQAEFVHLLADHCTFGGADLRGANLTGAWLVKADFTLADLRGAQLARAELAGAKFVETKLDDTDFSGANLADAMLAGLTLRSTRFDGAILRGANLAGSDLEEITIPGADLEGAWLRYANLTGSSLPAARLASANLRGAYLAFVDWERADLRDADLRGATFHMGSSRSGLVGSPIACEGSRTGFYTDDYNDQDFKPPEEIRKAKLRGCDLRGAKIDGVDFYLVDLREAKYTPDQQAILEQTGAILETRV